MSKKEKSRLDIAMVERGLVKTRSKAQGMIMAGEVLVNDVVYDKAGTRVSSADTITLKARPQFVSRGGDKLAGAIETFQLEVNGLVCADVGASTGGFTDCLLQAGAKQVYAIDVGYGQLDYSLRIDERVVVIERTNARYLEKLDELIDLAVVDASFISLTKLLPTIRMWLKPESSIVALIKPQFEAGRDEVGKGGIIRDSKIHRKVVTNILQFALENNFGIRGLIVSPILGATGNVEFLVWLSNQNNEQIDVSSLIESVLN